MTAKDSQTIAIGIGKASRQILPHVSEKGIADMILLSLDEQQGVAKVYPPGSSELSASPAEIITSVTSEKTKAAFFLLDAAEIADTEMIERCAVALKSKGVYTITLVALPALVWDTQTRQRTEATLKHLNRIVDAVILSPGNDAVAAIIATLDSIINEKGTSEIVIDFDDIKEVLQTSGLSIACTAEAMGRERVLEVVQQVFSHPFMTERAGFSSPKVLLNISTSPASELEMEELTVIIESIQDKFGREAEMIFGVRPATSLGDKIRLELIAAVSPSNS